MNDLAQELKELLGSTNTGLAFQSGKGLLYLASKLKHPLWLHPMLSSFGAFMENETSSLLLEMMKVVLTALPQLESSQQIQMTAILILNRFSFLSGGFRGTCHMPPATPTTSNTGADREERIAALHRVWGFLLECAVANKESIAQFQRFLESSTIASLWKPEPTSGGEECFIVATTSCQALYLKSRGTEKEGDVTSVAQFLMRVMLPCFSWVALDSTSSHRFLQFLDQLLTEHKKESESVLAYFQSSEVMEALPATFQSTLILFLLSKHSAAPVLSRTLECLRSKFLFYRPENENAPRTSIITSAQQQGYLGVSHYLSM